MNSFSPYEIKWLDLSYLGYPDSVGVGALPGCTFRFINRNLTADADALEIAGVKHVILLLNDSELRRFGAANLKEALECRGITCDQQPCDIGTFPPIDVVMDIISDVLRTIEYGHKTLIISRDGYGRCCTLAGAFLLHTNDNLGHDDAYDSLKKAIGPRALQTVKQYNFLIEFRNIREKYEDTKELEYSRSISR